MKRSKFRKNLMTIALWLVVLSSFVSVIPTWEVADAEKRTVEEILEELEKKRQEQAEKKEELAEIEEEEEKLEGESGSVYSQLSAVESKLEAAEEKVSQKEAEIKQMQQDIEVLEEYIEEEKATLGDSASQLYEMSQLSGVEIFFDSGNASTYAMRNSLRQKVMDRSKAEVDRLASEITMVQEYRSVAETEKVTLAAEVAKLQEEKNVLAAEYAKVKAQLASTSSAVSGIRAQIAGMQSEIDLLEAEQKRLEEEEREKLRKGGGGTQPLTSGEYYFRGTGRYIYDGHGIGMSQYGILGMGQRGWSWTNMLKHYYTGVSIRTASRTTLPVEGYGTMNIDTYVAGLGEVPDKACGTQQQANQRPDKYVVDNPDTIWDCWPENSIIAQVVAARTYGYYYTRSGKAICTTSACQVYKGGTAKQWAADETSLKYIYHSAEGGPIGAFYHASARGHTENNEYVWTANKYGDKGYAKAYLRGVDDSSYTYKNSYYSWGWRTNSYTLGKLSKIFAQWDATNVGSLKSIKIERGVSTRAWKITLVGSAGSKTVAGWYLKSLWNNWVYDTKPDGQRDYLYSKSLYFVKVQ